MNGKAKILTVRFLGYLGGFLLFYAPASLVQRLLISVFHLPGNADIHAVCSRVALTNLASGKGISVISIVGIVFALVFLSAFFLGPLFCGKLCPAGAFPEYLSRLIPEKFQVKLQSALNPAPVRYGMLAGFLIAPVMGYSVVCAYCNYTMFSRLTLSVLSLDVGILTSTNVITIFFWLIVLGAFTKGGRGYCSYICPVGAAQSLLHFLGAKFRFTYKLAFDPHRCVSCGLCAKECPTLALAVKDDGQLSYQRISCLSCGQCIQLCPKKALVYKNGADGWRRAAGDEKLLQPQPILNESASS
ncbi:MAG: 4Fe-4S binding protein [Synergistaceae bacterium]|jgi:polyferredoxin|nr:4Fe-4S binding protein [Synergistaceae bacterium]